MVCCRVPRSRPGAFAARPPCRFWVLAHGLLICLVLILSSATWAATTVPIEAQMPGTQPDDGVNLESPDKCDNCHQDDNPVVNVAHDWRGSMMAHAGRDPVFWATLAVAEQDFDGAGDICIRCHMHSGWENGHSTPTDGSTLSNAEGGEGVGCDVCHKMTNTDNGEWLGVQNPPFVANDGGSPAEGYYGSAQLSLWPVTTEKLGPYADAVPKHQFKRSLFHRDVDFCGSCHDVSNPVVGDLAPNNGAQQPLDPDTFDGQLDTPSNPRDIEDKAAFNNPPYKYGVVERTFSEYKAGLLSQTLVSDYLNLPVELQQGQIQVAWSAALAAGTGGNYADGAPRYFSCQTCHMHATTGLGCNKNGVPTRSDQPVHDLTGGNYWMPEVIKYMDGAGTLHLGTGLTQPEIDGLDAGVLRAQANLENAASMSVTGNTLRIVNLTGHKLISGYPEGRRMWINIKWYGANDALLREDGAYGSLQLDYDITGDGNVTSADRVDTLLVLDDPYTKVYEAHGAITRDWAAKLIAVSSTYSSVPVAYDRMTGALTATVGDVAAMGTGGYHETFHFVLNNKVVKDNRIPPYGMSYDEALKRSALPVPATQYGNPGPGGTYNYFDEVTLNPPSGALYANISLMYQPTSWEYIQFLDKANKGASAFLGNEGHNMFDAWFNNDMAPPYTMTTVVWTNPDIDGDGVPDAEDNCPNDPNPDQANNDGDSMGDVCDPDDDNDTVVDTADNCPFVANADQANFDGDSLGDACDPDDDNDGMTDLDEENYNGIAGYQAGEDPDPYNPDTDGDGLLDGADPLPILYNFADGNVAPRGAIDTEVNAGDLVVMLQFVLHIKTPTDLELAHGDVSPAGAPDGEITVADYLVVLKLVWQ